MKDPLFGVSLDGWVKRIIEEKVETEVDRLERRKNQLRDAPTRPEEQINELKAEYGALAVLGFSHDIDQTLLRRVAKGWDYVDRKLHPRKEIRKKVEKENGTLKIVAPKREPSIELRHHTPKVPDVSPKDIASFPPKLTTAKATIHTVVAEASTPVPPKRDIPPPTPVPPPMKPVEHLNGVTNVPVPSAKPVRVSLDEIIRREKAILAVKPIASVPDRVLPPQRSSAADGRTFTTYTRTRESPATRIRTSQPITRVEVHPIKLTFAYQEQKMDEYSAEGIKRSKVLKVLENELAFVRGWTFQPTTLLQWLDTANVSFPAKPEEVQKALYERVSQEEFVDEPTVETQLIQAAQTYHLVLTRKEAEDFLHGIDHLNHEKKTYYLLTSARAEFKRLVAGPEAPEGLIPLAKAMGYVETIALRDGKTQLGQYQIRECILDWLPKYWPDKESPKEIVSKEGRFYRKADVEVATRYYLSNGLHLELEGSLRLGREMEEIRARSGIPEPKREQPFTQKKGPITTAIAELDEEPQAS